MIRFEAFMPTRIVIGPDKVDSVGDLCVGFGKKALVVTGKSSMRNSGYTERVTGALNAAGIETVLFDRTVSNPERKLVNRAAETAREFGAEFVVGLGGGSALDTAKAASVVATAGGDIWDYVGGADVPENTLPIVAIPSTAGTGSEVTPYTVISDESSRRKNGFMSDWIIPKVAIIDPVLMSTVPSSLTANAGGDVLAQAVEAYTTKLAHSYSDLLALESVRLCELYLRRAVRNGKDLDARAAMGWASSLAGMAIAYVDVVIGHHASEAVGALYGTHHGETAATLLVPTLEFNFEQTMPRLRDLAEAMGRSTTGMDDEKAAREGVHAVRSLLRDIGIPERLSAIGVKNESIPEFIEILNERTEDLAAGNPCELTESSMREFFERAI